jgi:hypothetical protein
VVSVTPAQYFNKKRGLANGIVYAAGGLGGAVTSLAMDSLIQALGPAWTFRIVGILTLVTGLPAAWFIKQRTSIRSSGFVEWSCFAFPSSDLPALISVFLPAGRYSVMSASSFSSSPALWGRFPSLFRPSFSRSTLHLSGFRPAPAQA